MVAIGGIHIRKGEQMDLNKIRNMNDEELQRYLNSLSSRKDNSCYKCGKNNANYTLNVKSKKQEQQKKLCSLCNDCYNKMLEKMEIEDIIWN